MQYLMPFVDHQKYNISSKCRLHPDNDMFRDQELHKVHVDTNEWQCGFCKKTFRGERYLDQHFDNRHYDQLDHVRHFLISFNYGLFNMFLKPLKYYVKILCVD